MRFKEGVRHTYVNPAQANQILGESSEKKGGFPAFHQRLDISWATDTSTKPVLGLGEKGMLVNKNSYGSPGCGPIPR